jgi:RNA polymerase sigma factor (sigma-70 family)
MTNPFERASSAEAEDLVLIDRALEGDRSALRTLVERHQPFVYNVALKMFGNPMDAEDLTQEVFVKVITSLGTFRRASAFRTWLYRITLNHFLKTRRRGLEPQIDDFRSYFEAIAAVADDDGDRFSGATVEELRLRCTSGMLMCLDREQRITFILGGVFGVSHRLGAEVLGISPGNFRVRLHRARHDLTSWMNRRCGLVNQSNPCRCHKKAKAYVEQGAVDPERLVFNTDYTVRIEELTRKGARRAMATVEALHERVFRDQPFQVSKAKVVDEVLCNDVLKEFFDMSVGGTSRRDVDLPGPSSTRS